MSELREYLCIEAKTIEYKDSHGYRFTSATKSAPEAFMESVYLKSEADKVIAEKDKEIAELKADYKEACGRLQTANLIKDEQLAATRHNKYKRCLAMAKSCKDCAEMFGCMAFHEKLKHGETPHYQHCSSHANIKMCHRKKWLELAEKFKEAK